MILGPSESVGSSVCVREGEIAAVEGSHVAGYRMLAGAGQRGAGHWAGGGSMVLGELS